LLKEGLDTVRQIVEDSQILGESHGIVERHEHHVLTDRHPLGHGGDCPRNDQRRREIAVIDEVMFGQPKVIVAECVDEFDLIECAFVQFGKGEAR